MNKSELLGCGITIDIASEMLANAYALDNREDGYYILLQIMKEPNNDKMKVCPSRGVVYYE